MPEIAEVETTRVVLDRTMKNKKIKRIEGDSSDRLLFREDSAKKISKTLVGKKCLSTGRRGKYFWLTFEGGESLVIHLGMTGNFRISNAKKNTRQKMWEGVQVQSEPFVRESLFFCRLLVEMNNGEQIALIDPRRFARVWLSKDPLGDRRIKRLGRDPLEDFFSVEELTELLARRKISIKTLLLDQRVFAGVGNWLADEILYQSRLSPHHLASDLSLKQATELRKQTLSVIEEAVSVFANYEKFPASWLFHHRWGKNKAARTDRGDKIVHQDIGGRTTAWVPSRQK